MTIRQPELKIKCRNPADGKMVTIGALWSMNRGGFAGSINRKNIPVAIGDELVIYAYPNTPRPKIKTVADDNPAV